MLEELPSYPLGLVLRADEELIDPDDFLGPLDGDVAGRVTVDLGDEHRLPLEDGESPPVGAAVEAGKAEQEGLVGRVVRADVGLAVGHWAITRSTASCSSGDSAMGARPRSSCFT